MTSDFREELTHLWRMKRLAQTIADCREIRHLIEYDMRTLPLRPPCQCGASTHCGNCDCCRRR
jgi:hypothetical protein